MLISVIEVLFTKSKIIIFFISKVKAKVIEK